MKFLNEFSNDLMIILMSILIILGIIRLIVEGLNLDVFTIIILASTIIILTQIKGDTNNG